jgi:nitrite reductase (NADH) small subunit
MNGREWIRITAAENIPLREGRSVQVGDSSVAVFNLGDRFVALENRCPHRGGPLADGLVSSASDAVAVTCPLHNWRICVTSGQVLRPEDQEAGCVRTFEVKVEEGIVLLALRNTAQAAA